MQAVIRLVFDYCYHCPYCVERLADENDGAFDYPDMRLYCRWAQRTIVERVRYQEVETVAVPEWCPFVEEV